MKDGIVIYSSEETKNNENEPMFWSNEHGWCSLFDSDQFKYWHPNVFLPLGGDTLMSLQYAYELAIEYYQTVGRDVDEEELRVLYEERLV